ncbi:MAG: PfkB family carbohydrate kinase [Halobacteriales archaeon]|nr:PfkB family carbohydrate kinase [Halobacteriales archaeon]
MVVTGGESTRSLRLDDADLEYCRSADAVFTYGYVPDAAVSRLLDADTPPLAFDLPGPLEELRDRGTEAPTVDRAVAAAALFVAGRVATRDYLGCEPAAGLGELRERGVGRAALTDGEAGAHLLDGERSHAVPAFEVDAEDTTGAGDAFTAGLLDAWLLDRRPAAEAGRWAAAVAALNCRERTAQGGLPTRAEVERFLADRG